MFLPIFFVFNFNFLVFILFLISAYCSIVSLVCIVLLFVRCAQNFKYRAQQATYVDIFGPLWNWTKIRAKSWTRIQSRRIEKISFFWQLYASVFVRKIESQKKREEKDIWSKWMKSWKYLYVLKKFLLLMEVVRCRKFWTCTKYREKKNKVNKKHF